MLKRQLKYHIIQVTICKIQENNHLFTNSIFQKLEI